VAVVAAGSDVLHLVGADVHDVRPVIERGRVPGHHRVARVQRHQSRARPRRCRRHEVLHPRDAGVLAEQVGAHPADVVRVRQRVLGPRGHSEQRCEMHVDVGVDGQDPVPGGPQVLHEQRREGALPTTTLASESDFHLHEDKDGRPEEQGPSFRTSHAGNPAYTATRRPVPADSATAGHRRRSRSPPSAHLGRRGLDPVRRSCQDVLQTFPQNVKDSPCPNPTCAKWPCCCVHTTTSPWRPGTSPPGRCYGTTGGS
jgi:hypothetical protein